MHAIFARQQANPSNNMPPPTWGVRLRLNAWCHPSQHHPSQLTCSGSLAPVMTAALYIAPTAYTSTLAGSFCTAAAPTPSSAATASLSPPSTDRPQAASMACDTLSSAAPAFRAAARPLEVSASAL